MISSKGDRMNSEKISSLELDYQILKLLNEAKEPMGAVYLSAALGEKYGVSQSTIGRKLLLLDYQGHTKKVKNVGRVITEKGKAFLEELEDEYMYQQLKEDFMDALNPSNIDDIVDVLVARRGLERESCYLAAQNATPEHIAKMEQALGEQKRKIDKFGQAGDREDNCFHRWIAVASGNKVLLTTISLLRRENAFAMHLGTIRKMIGAGELYKEHVRILECIKAKDCRGAATAMEDHINKIILEFSNVRKDSVPEIPEVNSDVPK